MWRTETASRCGSLSTATTQSSPETFADAAAGELILYEDSYGLVTLAISRGDAARLTGATVGDELRIAVL